METATSFSLGETVKQKYFGVGRVDQVRPAGDGVELHVQFEKIACWCPSTDLQRAEQAAADRGPRREV